MSVNTPRSKHGRGKFHSKYRPSVQQFSEVIRRAGPSAWTAGSRHSGREVATASTVGYLVANMALKQLQLVVRGRVQGVYFRASTQREARRLGLSGWVRNRPDGSIEILAEGEEVSIRELYGWAQKGPSAARVERVDTRWRSFTGEFPDFRITS